MKRLSNLLAALVFASLVIFMSCGGGGDDPAPDPLEEVATDLTASAWAQPSTVQTDGGTPDGDWSGFSITFSGSKDGGSYTVSGVPDGFSDVWSNGTWSFGNTSGSVITKTHTGSSESTDMSATVSEGSLSLTFDVDEPTARTNGIAGEWTFVF
ncbi:hypothetical protein SAMN05421640_3011 [Ekhidna lutea]|uniref:Lipocalin-like domain-containing protein n=1 Tax=Ekhidna lutea TaxID=447679 RepID=A0A239L6S4_EKHLU|nr:hypothetical protein [Ekhidna lutea]SNT26025.1 hypothetical protein SAMN05421640_3011 [Ekhidna lutea]